MLRLVIPCFQEEKKNNNFTGEIKANVFHIENMEADFV